MSAKPFPFFPIPKDPDPRDKWSWGFALPVGRSFRVVTVTVVDASDAAISAPSLVIDEVTFALLDSATNSWGVSFFAVGGTPSSTPVLIRYRYWFDNNLTATPDGDRTVRMYIAHN